jgi:hypothetical protein
MIVSYIFPISNSTSIILLAGSFTPQVKKLPTLPVPKSVTEGIADTQAAF